MKGQGGKERNARHVLLSAVDPEDRYFDSGRDTPEEIARKDELERLAEDTSYKGLWKVSFTLKEL